MFRSTLMLTWLQQLSFVYTVSFSILFLLKISIFVFKLGLT